jgi:hypothetical protein
LIKYYARKENCDSRVGRISAPIILFAVKETTIEEDNTIQKYKGSHKNKIEIQKRVTFTR